MVMHEGDWVEACCGDRPAVPKGCSTVTNSSVNRDRGLHFGRLAYSTAPVEKIESNKT